MARLPLRPPFLLPSHTDRRFAASSPICSPLPYFPSLFSQPAASTFNTPSILAKHQYRHSTLTRPRTTTASTMRCMPGCPHLHIAAFIAARQTLLPVPDKPRRTPFSIPPFQQHRKWPRPCRHIRLHPQNTRQIRLHQYALLTRYFKISALFLHLQLGAAYGTPKGHGLPAMYERLRKNKICSTPPPQTGAVYCPCGPANTATRRDA